MLTSRYIDRICIAITVIALIVTTLFMFGENLGIEKIVDEDAEGHEAVTGFTENDLDDVWDTEDATVITLDGDTARIFGGGAYTDDGSVYIMNGGKYLISGSLTDGNIIVDAYDSSKVWIRFDNVDVCCSDDAALRINTADKVFLTLAEGSENSLSDGAEYSSDALSDRTGGVIYSHEDLTINGKGSLDIRSEYMHGIECNDTLVIAGGKISISAVKDGINANDAVNFTEAELSVSAGDDGINAGGSFLMTGGTIEISKCYEGIEAVTIDIKDGDIDINCEDDGLNANGNTGTFGQMPGGMEPGSGNDRGQHEPPEGFMNGPGSKDWQGRAPLQWSENTEPSADTSADSEIVDVEDTWIHISGGNITVRNETGRDSDGLDSNGNIEISGGNIRVSLSGSGGNCALDWAGEAGGKCTVSGGTIVACGSSSMVEAIDASSAQCSILCIPEETTGNSTQVLVKDEEGKMILEWEAPYAYTAVHLSSPDIKVGGTYTIEAGGQVETVTISETSTHIGQAKMGR
ncbi:MAG: carbohydrate-binding domain-containing protein [Lachnospiraceae bacterium]|nr:carbohydrate-binding domain-containing protein [Lachnospiraceae bacterium]